jgi:hypothetical protein
MWSSGIITVSWVCTSEKNMVHGDPAKFLLIRASLIVVNSERLYMWSGEIHYWRIPCPELWIDVLQKIKVRPSHHSQRKVVSLTLF